MTETARIVVVGAGPVGAAFALALAQRGVEPLVIDARDSGSASDDPRPLALSYGSRLILDRLQVWHALEPVTPIERIHVSQRGGFGRVLLTAAEAGLPALGYVVDYARLDTVIRHTLSRRIPECIWGATVDSVIPGREVARIEFTRGGVVSALDCRMAVIADGGTFSGEADVRTIDYHQQAVVATVTAAKPHRCVAYERFTDEGPLALLPFGEQLALIWSASVERARELMELSDAGFLARLNEHFGSRLGAFRAVTRRTAFPLTLRFARNTVLPRVALIGNAAQTLHPVAGQGLNLGLRDAWELAEEIARTDPQAIGTPQMLARYDRRRAVDRYGGTVFTDALVRLFSNAIVPFRAARGIGLAVLGCMPPARDFLVRRMIFGTRG